MTGAAASPRRAVAVLAIHGMGNPTPGFAEPLFRGLARRLGDDAARVALEPCFWSDLLEGQQEVTWQRMTEGGPAMRQRTLRRWIVRALGDPAGYLSGYLRDHAGGAPAYVAVHERVRDTLRRLERRLARDGRPADAPLVVLAHSLGGVVMSNYLWDQQAYASGVLAAARPDEPPATPSPTRPLDQRVFGETPFERGETLTAIVTYGCNIPLFLPPAAPTRCIAFPPPTLSPALRRAARWLNVFDPDDVLGYPIARIWDQPPERPIEDVALDVGWPLLSATPLAHTLYDRSARFQARVREVLGEVLAAVPPEGVPGG